MARRLAPLLAVVSAGVALASACTTDHGALDKRDWGSGGTLADSGGGGGSEAGAGGAQDAGADAPVEPSGGKVSVIGPVVVPSSIGLDGASSGQAVSETNEAILIDHGAIRLPFMFKPSLSERNS